ncbi:MAG TPA: Rossmann-like and DUF2520 domain-containing protein [Candidatus Angelobacter sp.]|nr:Rossmann-like and DUF2520 domain-containing protein [Candidatus Angelobacter sp.]
MPLFCLHQLSLPPRFPNFGDDGNFGNFGNLFVILAVMPRRHIGKPAITLIGAGNLARALGPALHAAGYKVDAVAARETASSRRRAAMLARALSAKAIPLANATPDSDIIWICHTDDALAETARQLARKRGWQGKIVFHSSGALSSDVLSPLRRAGALVASLHPMMTFVPGASPKMSEVPFAMEGDRLAVIAARRLIKNLGAEIFPIQKRFKTLYHALGSFSSPMLVATLATAERVGRAAGLSPNQTRRIIAPILRETIKNYSERGPAAAFSGPIKRGDINTIRRHLRELKRVPAASEVYRALVKSALMDLPARNRRELRRLIR